MIDIKYVLTFVAGAVIGNFIKERREEKKGIKPLTFKVGDKVKDIAALQYTLNKILGIDFIGEVGNYDNETKKVVVDIFEGTRALIDEDTGEISKEFVLDFIKIFERL